MSKEMLSALEALEQEKGISKDIVIEALEAALVSAYKRHYGQAQNVEVEFEQKKGNIHVYAVKEVTEEVMDSQLEVSLKEALTINPAYELGDTIRFEVTPKDFGRIAAQTAKQVILQRVREAERTIIYNEFSEYENDIMTGIVERQDRRYIYVNLGKIEAVLSRQDQIPNEVYQPHDRIKVYVSKVENTSKGPQVFVSRSHPDLLKRLFEQEIPEVYDGIVEIVSIAREAGDRAKVAVRSIDPNVDPVGTCVGPKGQRVQAIVNELKGENMDIVEWNEDPAIFIANALNPAEVQEVIFSEGERSCTVVVPDYQLSLAIGKRGQNARLAAKLTNYKIDIKSESDMLQQKEEAETEAVVSEEIVNDEVVSAAEVTPVEPDLDNELAEQDER
ncbi:transcription termination factor NusA [Vagococcus humatus]|uniref:Transcription termination/antitermination protein NusA n=1 Tax=Vagococcus humatus TaxID=1889241 RepID=A0A3R9YF38_9ENTE|nr:transcription termination factor NusA [Vagococcus humatus]RST89755.1 transcription termination/antitermination protein NusA [Vagococcus humatus]